MQNVSLEAELLKKIPRPAFFVADGIITKVNRKASLLKIKAGTAIDSLIRTGFDEYQTYVDGRLCLTLMINYIAYDASVVKYHNRDLFFIENEFLNPDLCMLSVAVTPLMDPVSDAMLCLENIRAFPELKDNADLITLNHNFYRIYKIVMDMHDAAFLNTMRKSKVSNYELTSEIKKIVDKADFLLREADLRMEYTCEIQDELYGSVDLEKIERAILALAADMFHFNKPTVKVKVNLRKEQNRILLSMKCSVPNEKCEYLENILLSCHIDNDGLDTKEGRFNGAIMARNAIASHLGTMLIDRPRARQLRFTLSIPLVQLPEVRSLVSVFDGFAEGYDHNLLSFAEVLPDKSYK